MKAYSPHQSASLVLARTDMGVGTNCIWRSAFSAVIITRGLRGTLTGMTAMTGGKRRHVPCIVAPSCSGPAEPVGSQKRQLPHRAKCSGGASFALAPGKLRGFKGSISVAYSQHWKSIVGFRGWTNKRTSPDRLAPIGACKVFFRLLWNRCGFSGRTPPNSRKNQRTTPKRLRFVIDPQRCKVGLHEPARSRGFAIKNANGKPAFFTRRTATGGPANFGSGSLLICAGLSAAACVTKCSANCSPRSPKRPATQ